MTQLLADLGAEVIKIGRPGTGDDARGWGPQYVLDAEGKDTRMNSHFLILAVGNDAQFACFVGIAGAPGLAEESRFATNAARVRNRTVLAPLLSALRAGRTAAECPKQRAAKTAPVNPVNDLEQVFSCPQGVAQGLPWMDDADTKSGAVILIGNPLHLSPTPVSYAEAAPMLVENTMSVLARKRLHTANLRDLASAGVIEGKPHS